MTKVQTTDRILDIAEREIRSGGYDAVSFRDIASEIGIKSASVHYHFPTKADLGERVARRYTDSFMAALGDPTTGAVSRYVAQYRKALTQDGKMCLCGLFGAQIDVLPAPVADEVRRFFTLNLDWLTAFYAVSGQQDPNAAATRTLALLEGALIVARAMGDLRRFDEAVSELGT